MKIIEGLKKVKHLEKKINDLTEKIGKYCADTELDEPIYADQKGQISQWLQSVHDSTLEIERLKYRINKTNISTLVKIEINGKHIEKSIYEWILRRTKLARFDEGAWKTLSDRGLQALAYRKSQDGTTKQYNVRLYYDPKEKDSKISEFMEEPSLIDGRLEIVNAITDLLD